MTRSDFQRTMRSIAKLNQDLERLLKDLQSLSRHLGQDLGAVMESEVTQRLRAAQGVLDGFARLAASMQSRVGEVASRVPRAGRAKAAPTPSDAGPAAGRKPARKKTAPSRKKKAPAKAGKAARKASPKGGAERKGARAKLTAAEAAKALEAAGGVKTKAAKQLGVSVPTLNKYLKRAA